ncbi:MAG: hypothetical protein ABGW77_02065 [Campylobacterales bacterium]
MEEYLLLYPLPQLVAYLPEARKSKQFKGRCELPCLKRWSFLLHR